MNALYDQIGDGYDHTRKADPYLVSRLIHHLQPTAGADYADFGCGTGNYTIALSQQGVNITGIDQSQHMIEKAREKAPQLSWHQADVGDLPFKKGAFAGGIATLTVHHWQDLNAGFKEIAKVVLGS